MIDTNIYTELPKGWAVDKNAQTAPPGYVWINNNKSWFGGERVNALMKKPEGGA